MEHSDKQSHESEAAAATESPAESQNAETELSRRSLMHAGAGLAAGAALAGCAFTGGDEGADSISLLGHITYNWPAQLDKFEEVADFSVDETIVSYAGIQQNLFANGNEEFDAAGFEGIIGRPALVFNDLGVSTPTSELDTYTEWSEENIADIFTRPTERLGYLGAQAELLEETIWDDPEEKTELKMIPTNYNFDSVGYNPKFIEPGSVSSWSPMFNEEYEGQVALGSVPVISVAETVMHLMDVGVLDQNVDRVNNPTEDQINQAVDFLLNQKDAGQFRSLWSATGESAELMSSEEAVVGNIWEPAMFSVRGDGTPCRYAKMEGDPQGFALTTGGYIPTKPGAQDNETVGQVRDWAHFHHGAWYADFVAKKTGYNVPHYPNTDLLRDGEDETGQGMGPEFYDWAYNGAATYDAVDEPALFQPQSYDWSTEEGESSSDGQQRDVGDIDSVTDSVGTWYTFPDAGNHLNERWTEFVAG
jgi:hypothetical protein